MRELGTFPRALCSPRHSWPATEGNGQQWTQGTQGPGITGHPEADLERFGAPPQPCRSFLWAQNFGLGLSPAPPVVSEAGAGTRAGTRDALCVYAALGPDSRGKNEARLKIFPKILHGYLVPSLCLLLQGRTWQRCSKVWIIAREGRVIAEVGLFRLTPS